MTPSQEEELLKLFNALPMISGVDLLEVVKEILKPIPSPLPMQGNNVEAASKYLSLKRREIQKHAGLFATPTTRDYDEWMVAYAQQFQKQNWVSDEEIENLMRESYGRFIRGDLQDGFIRGAKSVRAQIFKNGKT